MLLFSAGSRNSAACKYSVAESMNIDLRQWGTMTQIQQNSQSSTTWSILITSYDKPGLKGQILPWN